jgi:hypothetical protein
MTKIATPQNVFAAADELSRQGLQPNIQRIRNRIGGGSLNTLALRLREWKEEQKLKLPQRPQKAD